MQSQAETVVQHLAEVQADRCDASDIVRSVIIESLPSGYKEFVQAGMAGCCVPLSGYLEPYKRAPLNYLTPVLQKNRMAGYLTGYLGDAKSAESGKKRDDLPLDAIGTPAGHMPGDDFTSLYECSREGRKRT